MNQQNKINEVEVLLMNYRTNKALLESRKFDLASQEELLRYHNTPSVESDIEAIAGMSLQAQKLSSMPRNGGISNPVDRIMSNYYRELMPLEFDRNILEKAIFENKLAIRDLEKKINQIDVLISTLHAKERFIVEKFYKEGLYMKDICKAIDRTINTVRSIRKEAVNKMLITYLEKMK